MIQHTRLVRILWMKLYKAAPVNVVFTLDAPYDEVTQDFQCPNYRQADYSLATSDGALKRKDTPFADLNPGHGRKLVRHEVVDPTSNLPTLQKTNTMKRHQCDGLLAALPRE